MILLSTDSRVQTATPEMIQATIIRLGYLFGHTVEPARAHSLSKVIARVGWTKAELDYAEALIPVDVELVRQVSYERTIGPGIFALAKTKTSVMRGRLFEYREARQYCAEHPVRMEEVFDVVRVEGVNLPDESLKPFWVML